MTRYLDPTNDVSFKKLFGETAHKSLLISFLNAVLNLKEDRKIKDVQLLPNDESPVIKDLKSVILDVKCTDVTGRQYIVEMQNRKVEAFVKRVQFYAAHNYTSQVSAGEAYVSLKPVILLCIANHTLFPDKSSVVSYHQTLDIHTNENDLKDLSYVFIELPKFCMEEDELEAIQDKWIYFFKNWERSTEVPATMYEEELKEAYRIMEQFNWTRAEYEAYVKVCISQTDEDVLRQTERAEGKAEGIEIGKAETETKAKMEKIAIAKKLILQGMSIDSVYEITGLSKEDLT